MRLQRERVKAAAFGPQQQLKLLIDGALTFSSSQFTVVKWQQTQWSTLTWEIVTTNTKLV